MEGMALQLSLSEEGGTDKTWALVSSKGASSDSQNAWFVINAENYFDADIENIRVVLYRGSVKINTYFPAYFTITKQDADNIKLEMATRAQDFLAGDYAEIYSSKYKTLKFKTQLTGPGFYISSASYAEGELDLTVKNAGDDFPFLNYWKIIFYNSNFQELGSVTPTDASHTSTTSYVEYVQAGWTLPTGTKYIRVTCSYPSYWWATNTAYFEYTES